RPAVALGPARHLVAATADLAGRMQGRHHDLGRGATLVLGMLVDRDAPAVVRHTHGAVGAQRHLDPRAVPGHRLVDGVVDDLPDQVVEAARARRPDVHTGPLAHGIETLEHLDVLSRIVAAGAGTG